MGMQRDADEQDYPTVTAGATNMAAPAPVGPAGDACLINQDEAEIIEASYEYTQVVSVDQPGFAESRDSIQGVWREQAL